MRVEEMFSGLKYQLAGFTNNWIRTKKSMYISLFSEGNSTKYEEENLNLN